MTRRGGRIGAGESGSECRPRRWRESCTSARQHQATPAQPAHASELEVSTTGKVFDEAAQDLAPMATVPTQEAVGKTDQSGRGLVTIGACTDTRPKLARASKALPPTSTA